MKKYLSIAVVFVLLVVVAVIGPAAISNTSTNVVYAQRMDSLTEALRVQVEALRVDVSNLVVKANATTNFSIVISGTTSTVARTSD